MQLCPYKVLVTDVKSSQGANITETLRYDL